ncbi:kinase-like domain-containing protein [Podospora appendiculata]|uniref:Kinase-like domain-containing protein n=1 Tax=Podospora appendiculata TaxID=314037 RepID=A0AAE0X710_9PEZI|nr:kinase-like domain-containing protein [Podospora appendiculata]
MTSEKEYTPQIRHYRPYFPPGVKRVIAHGGSAWIGEVDDSTVLKYPAAAGEDVERLVAERTILEAIPPHQHVIGYKGSIGEGIYLERVPNGTVSDYILDSGKPLSPAQRLAWCRETAEAVAWIHRHRVLHCDIQPSNLLLDKDLHIKLTDFQGRLLAENGTTLVDGCSIEPYRFGLPRDDFRADVKTDLFSLGSTIYFILMGHYIYPDIAAGEAGAWNKVEARLRNNDWPREHHICGAVTLKCWEQQYESAEEVVRDLEAIERECTQSAAPDGLAGTEDEKADDPQ